MQGSTHVENENDDADYSGREEDDNVRDGAYFIMYRSYIGSPLQSY